MLENYIKNNIDQYKLDSTGYADLTNHDPQDEFEIMARDDDSLLDEVIAHHIDDPKALQIDIVKAMYGDWKAGIRMLAAFKKGLKSYLSYQLDDLSHDEVLLRWQEQYADDYAKSAAIEMQIESALMESEDAREAF